MAANGATSMQYPSTRNPAAKPPPSGPAPPVPSGAPPSTPLHSSSALPSSATTSSKHAAPPGASAAPAANGSVSHTHSATGAAQKTKKKAETSVDPVAMYESVRNRIAALEEEEVHGEEEERRIAEEAHTAVRGMSESVVHTKYIDLYQEMKRLERDYAKEKQKLVKDKDTAKSQLTKANQNKTRFENVARELQKENKKLREDSRTMSLNAEKAQDEIHTLKIEMERRTDKAKRREKKFLESPDIVIRVVCKYRAELFFKISRKTKFSKLFAAWTERMETTSAAPAPAASGKNKSPQEVDVPVSMMFLFTYMGRSIEPDQTPEEVGMDEGDEILAVEMMDLTKDETEEVAEVQRQRLKKNWTSNPEEAKKALEEIFDSLVRERLKDVLRQYELREKHFECVIRSKELEVLLSRARAEEQKSLLEQERRKASENEAKTHELKEEAQQLKEQSLQARLLEDLRACCEAPTPERTQRLFTHLRDELERRGAKLPDASSNAG